MKPTLFVIAGAVAILVTISAIRAIRKPEPAAVLQLAGIILLLVTVLIHFAEALSLLPRMGWGRHNTPGHYLDLVSVVSGMVLLVAGICLRVFGTGGKAT